VLSYKLLNIEKIDDMLFLQKIVVFNLKDSNYFRPSTKDMLIKFIKNGYVLGAFYRDELVAYRIIYFPRKDKESLGLDLGIKQNQLEYIMHLETTIVHPKFRHRKLQIDLTNEILKYIDTKDKIICTTCYPYNYPSLSNLFRLGLSINIIKEKYDDRLRFILTNREYKIGGEKVYKCDCQNIEKIKEFLNSGYIGIKAEFSKSKNEFYIVFKQGVFVDE